MREKKISLEAANAFMEYNNQFSFKIASAVFLLILSPVCQMLLTTLATHTAFFLSQNAADIVGITILVSLCVIAVGKIIYYVVSFRNYNHFVNSVTDVEYGVGGMINKKKANFAPIFKRNLIIGLVTCMVGMIPLLVAKGVQASELTVTICTCILLWIVAVGVRRIIWTVMIEGGFHRIIQ